MWRVSLVGLVLAGVGVYASTSARLTRQANIGALSRTASVRATWSALRSRPVVVKGPTLVAFFRTTQAEVDSSGEVSETLSDFDYYLANASDSLRALGIAVYERYTDTIPYVVHDTARRFVAPPDSGGVGYLFLVPNGPAKARYGLLSDDLIVVARNYFREALSR